MSDEFVAFPKIARLSRQVIVTEKIDGTNACIAIDEQGQIRAGSRSQWLTVENDNYGFAAWVAVNHNVLLELGVGTHHGEWFGHRIGKRQYGLNERRFALFNTSRWNAENRPACCEVVPVLYDGVFDTAKIDACLEDLRLNGSRMVAGFMQPEGVIIYHTAANIFFKKTMPNDGAKGKT
ncbi:MAG: RNA ligase family protein [Chloroflexi bacterium]|nr:RNA ligase family protein [Chloroflexota bacterium]